MTIEREDHLHGQADQSNQTVTEGAAPDANLIQEEAAEAIVAPPTGPRAELPQPLLATLAPTEKVTVPDEAEPATERRSPWGKIVGASAAVLAIAGGTIFMLGRGGSNDSEASPVATAAPAATAEATTPTEPDEPVVVPATDAPAPTTTENAAAVPPTEVTSDTEAPEGSVEIVLNGTVTFDHLGNLTGGTDPILTTQPNGDPLEVPRLDPSSPESLTYTALNLLACYATMGDEACKTALTDSPDVNIDLDELRDGMQSIIRPGDAVQVAMFSNPENPATFKVSTVNRWVVVELTGGELYVERLIDSFGENEWQGDWTREFVAMGPRDLVATELLMQFRQEDENGWSPDNEPVLKDIEFHFKDAR